MKAKIKEFRILIISVVIALVIVIANMIVSSQVWNKNLNNQSMAIQKLNGDIEKQRVSSLNAADSAKSRVTGLDTKRVKTDDGIIESKVLKKYFTWKSGADYEALKKDFDENFATQAIKEAVEGYAATYGETVLYSSARNEYAITRMSRILTRTVLTLQQHLKQGSFQPDDYELSFRFAENLDSIHVDLSEEEKMHLQGRIDRIDVSEDAEHVYVKVIDYKSGNKKFDLAALYYGLQLQLVVYMNAAMELESRKHPDKEIVPAALLYYHIDDPTIETPVELTQEQINEEILTKLRMNGVVNSDPAVVERLDRFLQDKSKVIPVEKKKDGSFSARSGILSREELQVVSAYVDTKIRQIGREILDGKIAANPYEKGNEEACTYCAYKKVCGFDGSIPGYEKRQLEDLDKQTLMQRMQETTEA